MSNLTPMMQQYMEIKDKYRDCILFFRLGDFYEMFFDDAITASRELEITLTGRDCGMIERAPMCGVPFHSAENYISRLILKGFKVAICEQVEDPATAKGIVKRDVIRVVTPGTVTEVSMLDDKKNNYLVSIYKKSNRIGISVVDLSTGEFEAAAILDGNTKGKLIDELAKLSPSEVIANEEFFSDEKLMESIEKRFTFYKTKVNEECYSVSFAIDKLKDRISCSDGTAITEESIIAAGALLEYLESTQKCNLGHLGCLKEYSVEGYMLLDISTRRNLELTETMREKSRKGTLLWVLDRTMTSMGSRLLRKWIEQPLINRQDIIDRLNAVNELKDKFMLRMEVRELLKRVYDIERLVGRVVLGSANCRDLISLKNSIGQVPYIKDLIKNVEADKNKEVYDGLDELKDIYELIDSSIMEEPPISLREGGLIKQGFNEEVDKLKKAMTEGKTWLAALESEEKEKTGIKNLKIGFNKVFGYYLEVTKSYYSLVPDYYVRKQTLANCERYITQPLKEIEDTVLGAEEKVVDLEYRIYVEVREKIASEVIRLKNTAIRLSELDSLCSLAEVADREDYCCPEITDDGQITIADGRHPVVEKMLGKDKFVPNDTILDLQENRLSVITGPNMAGKSTYMRQVALITLMAQIGSFVPASKAVIGITDRIFTRVGASDDLAAGQSTFMVEMSEVANILTNATSKSLLILDEIGRGTSTYDGLSIAWAVIEFINDHRQIGARTLFATHYHELTELEGKFFGIKNYCIAVEEKGEDIIFLRKIIRGGADGSYGIQVARLAGVPAKVLTRAKTILKELEDADIIKKESKNKKAKAQVEGQIGLFQEEKKEPSVIRMLKEIDTTALTPMQAMNFLYELQQEALKG